MPPRKQVVEVSVLSIANEDPQRYQGRLAIYSPVHGMVYVGPMDPNAIKDALATGVPDPRRFLTGYNETRVSFVQNGSSREVVQPDPENAREIAEHREW